LNSLGDISLAVYLQRLGPDGSEKAIAQTGLDKIRRRAEAYYALTRAYLHALNISPAKAATTAPIDEPPPKKATMSGAPEAKSTQGKQKGKAAMKTGKLMATSKTKSR
jgi:hypothetical protein